MRHFTWASLLIIGVITAVASGQTGAISGSVLDRKNKAVGNALVTANFPPVSGAADPKTRNLHVTTDKSGNFSFSNVPVGVYRICVQASDPSLLDPCRWALPVLAKLAPNQNVSGLRIVLRTGSSTRGTN